MLFSSTVFLFLFLPSVLFTYFIVPRIFKNTILLAASLFFYAWGEPKFVLVMLVSIILNYLFALIVNANREDKIKVRWIMAVMIVTNLAILGIFKYANFLVQNMNILFGTSIYIPEIPLPIGISFYTFQAISYVIDVYRKDGSVQRNPLNLALYISLFPQLIAGPIVRYQTVAEQITKRKETFQRFAYGTKRFIIGLGKKMFLANNCGYVADQVFALNPSEMSTSLAWIGIIAYSLQIYFDFSGYSDMAIGLGKMFGFDFLENFNYPYISRSVTEFWRRWHISLGTWFRDYIYIPLGGNRKGPYRTYFNLLVVWMATGIWHGASWTFLMWGLYYCFFIMMEKAFFGRILERVPMLFQHIYAVVVILIGWVFFRSETFSYAFSYIKTMFGVNGIGAWDPNALFYFTQYGIVMVISLVGSIPILRKIVEWSEHKAVAPDKLRYVQGTFLTGFYIIVLLLAVVCMVSNTFNPFIYFRF